MPNRAFARWPADAEELIRLQNALAAESPPAWRPGEGPLLLGGCFVCFGRNDSGPGAPGDRGWAGAALWSEGGVRATAVADGRAAAGYAAGLLALREGPLLEAGVRALPATSEILLVDATGRDHPRRAGLALHLGAVLEVPTIGVTHRPLLAQGGWPGEARGSASPLLLDGEIVGYWLRTATGSRPLAVHAAWRTDPETAVNVVLGALERARTPEPLRLARQAARLARDRAERGRDAE